MCCESSKGRIKAKEFTDFPSLSAVAVIPESPIIISGSDIGTGTGTGTDLGNGQLLKPEPARQLPGQGAVVVRKKLEVHIAPQPMCQFKSITCGVLDRLGTYFPGETGEEPSQKEAAENLSEIRSKGASKFPRPRMHRRCLCDTIRPILKLSQYVGVVPLSIHHPLTEMEQVLGCRPGSVSSSSSSSSSGACQLVFKWKSFGGVANTVLTLGFLIYLPFSFVHTKNKMGKVFDGTDLYAFTLQTVAMILETTILLFCGRFLRCKFMKGWAELNEVYHALCDSAGDLQRIKASSYIASFIIILEMIVFSAYSFLTGCGNIKIYKGYWDLALWTLASNLTLFIPYTLSTLFLFICLLIRSHFVKISEMLDFVVKKPNTQKLHLKIDSLRVLHEQLCQAVSDFETFFGIQILLTLCTGCFTVTTGAYASIVQGEGISSSTTQQETAAWAMQMYSAAIFMLLILIAGQLMTNSASSPAPVLNSLSFVELDAETRIQVQAFLQKISAFPTQMSALKITNVSTTFLASAATNITTYLLVLMQFKLSLENSCCGGGGTSNTDGLTFHQFNDSISSRRSGSNNSNITDYD